MVGEGAGRGGTGGDDVGEKKVIGRDGGSTGRRAGVGEERGDTFLGGGLWSNNRTVRGGVQNPRMRVLYLI